MHLDNCPYSQHIEQFSDVPTCYYSSATDLPLQQVHFRPLSHKVPISDSSIYIGHHYCFWNAPFVLLTPQRPSWLSPRISDPFFLLKASKFLRKEVLELLYGRQSVSYFVNLFFVWFLFLHLHCPSRSQRCSFFWNLPECPLVHFLL